MKPTLTAEEQAALGEVRESHRISEEYLKTYRRECDERFAQYQGMKGLDQDLRRAGPNDRDSIWRETQDEWGSDLTPPIAFWVVETVLPRAVSNRPRMLVLPRDEDGERNVENMKYLIDHQQQQIQYDLKLEETAKSGFIYGLGAQKLYWVTRFGQRPSLNQQLMGDPRSGAQVPMWVEGPMVEEPVFDDWTVEDIDIRELFWDPFGHFLPNYPGESGGCRYVIHRTWRDHRYVLERIQRGDWMTDAAQVLEPDDITALASQQKWTETHQQSQNLAGFTNTPQGNRLHEVWEFHDGERVITVLDRQIPVVIGVNPARHKQMPFSVFRPATSGIKQLPGMGVIQPIQQLIREMSTLRSQRRDNAALKLAQVFAYSDGSIDAGDLQFFPGAAIPVHGEPRDFLYPVQVGDIPNSSYNEEDRIQQDVERASGISDSVTGADASQGAASTATGVQLVQAAANVRIQRQTRRLEVELVTRECQQAVALNQQMIVRQQQRTMMVPHVPKPGEMGPVYCRVQVTPPELMGQFAIEVEGGSLAPKNMPQQVQLATQMLQVLGQDPDFDTKAIKLRAAELFGFSNPEAVMAAEEPPIDPDVLDRLQKAGVNPDLIRAAVQASNRENPPQGQAQPQQGASGELFSSEAPSQQAAA
jgi:hypothetical protein